MNINVNAYNQAVTPKTTTANQSTSTSASAKSSVQNNGQYEYAAGSSDLGMQDFLNLLTTQLANQDIMNPQSDTEFIAQMAQFSSLEAMQTLTELTYAQYGSSMVGKNVLIASYDSKGEITQETGVVTHVKLMGGSVTVTVNGEDYDMSSIMDILHELPKDEDEDKDPEDIPLTPLVPSTPTDDPEDIPLTPLVPSTPTTDLEA